MNNRVWNWMIFRGIFGVIFGILAFMWPISALVAVAALFSVYVLIAGALSLGAAYEQIHEHRSWGVLMVQGLVGVIAGLAALFYPGLALMSLVILIAAWALLSGLLEVSFAIGNRENIDHPVWLGLAGFVSLLFGGALLAWPLSGLTFLVAFIGAYALVNGAFLIAWGARRHMPEDRGEKRRLRSAYT
jgi:uncharacterized membrane protein HdeD (DUF308 family)